MSCIRWPRRLLFSSIAKNNGSFCFTAHGGPQTKIRLVLAVRSDVGLLGSLAAIQSWDRRRDRLKSQQRLVEVPKRFEQVRRPK